MKLIELVSTEIGNVISIGKTKIFIRRPNTLFKLEEDREAQLPRMATLIQKIFRGYLAKKLRIRLVAARRIITFINRYHSTRFIKEFIRTFQGVGRLTDLGKSIVWPVPTSNSMKKSIWYLHCVWKCWRAEQVFYFFLFLISIDIETSIP